MTQVSHALLYMVICMIMLSCQGDKKPYDVPAEAVEHLADLQCQARALKRERIALADTIRFREDRLLSGQVSEDEKDFLEQYMIEVEADKDDMYQRTKTMADSIKSLQMELWQTYFPDPDDRTILDSLIHHAFIRQCPLVEDFEKDMFQGKPNVQ